MGFLDNSTITVDAILTKRGRQILSRGGNFKITKFALSDEEVDYTLYDVTHPNGSDSYGTVIENISLLEATPNRANFRSFLVNQTLAGAKLNIDQENYTSVEALTTIAIAPTTIGAPEETYTFVIDNLNVVGFQSNLTGKSRVAKSVTLVAKSINTQATTTVTITGNTSGLSKVIAITVTKDVASNTSPYGPQPSVDDYWDTEG
jgi:hypothetical protein